MKQDRTVQDNRPCLAKKSVEQKIVRRDDQIWMAASKDVSFIALKPFVDMYEAKFAMVHYVVAF